MENERRVVVIGSGPAGGIAARELVRSGIPVTMLEAGERLQPGVLLRLWGSNLYRRKPRLPESRLHTISGDPRTVWYTDLTLGGLSNHWTGAVPRFAPEDFTEGERLHERFKWPLTYEELVPFYEKVEPLLMITGSTADVLNLPAGQVAYPRRLPEKWQEIDRLAKRHGQALTTMPLADGPPSMLVRRGTAFNSFTNIVRPLLNSPHFQLKTGAHALHLEWSPAKHKVDAVVYHDRHSGQTRRLAADAVVIACGALRSVKLLFDSACKEFPEGMGNSEGILGRFLHDHPREWWTFDVDRPLALLSPPAYLTRLPYDSSAPLMATSWTLGTVGLKDRIRSRFGGAGNTVGVQVFGTMLPSEKCHAKPSPEQKDEFGLPGLDIDIRFSDEEVDNVVRSRQHLLNLMAEAGYHARLGDVVPQLFPGTAAHFGGTVRMHAKRKYGVLDSWNRVYDAPNVIVCDAGCFTTAAEKNPTLTVMALALRAAWRLSEDLKHGYAYEN